MKLKLSYTKSKAALLSLMLSMSFTASAEPSTVQRANFLDFPAMSSATGSAATLSRKLQSLESTMMFSALDPETAYTVWWAVFNNPENCVNGAGKCGVADIGNPDAALSLFYATGFITSGSGTANITANLDSGDLPGGTSVLAPGGLRNGNGFHAEIMMMLRTHSSVLPDSLAMQISSYNGGCDVNFCIETQAAPFPPVQFLRGHR